MKFLCDHCERLVDAGEYRLEAGALRLRCPKCQAESAVEGAPEAANEAAPASPAFQAEARPVVVPFAPRPSPVQLVPAPEPIPVDERCPKCAAAKNGRAACAKCGLVFELYKPEQDVVPQSARREFERLLELQGTPDAERSLDHVGPAQVAHLARLCRHHLADFPDDLRATAILDRLTARSLALAAAAAQSESLGHSSGSGKKGLVIAVAALAFLSLLALLSVLVRAA